MKITLCDLCHRQMELSKIPGGKHLKVKENVWFRTYEDIDVCGDCIEKLRKAAKKNE